MKLFNTSLISLGLVVSYLNAFNPHSSIIYHDDFSNTRSEWNLGLAETLGNSQAINASYARIEGGYLRLKANVSSGWDYLFANAALDMMLPEQYTLTYRARKSQWAGHFSISLLDQFESSFEMQNHLQILYYKEHGHWRDPLRFAESSDDAWVDHNNYNDSLSITDNAGYFNYGVWHDYKFIKSEDAIYLFIDDVVVHQSSFTDFEGNYLVLSAIQAGSTVDIDYLTITTVPEPASYALLLGGLALWFVATRRV